MENPNILFWGGTPIYGNLHLTIPAHPKWMVCISLIYRTSFHGGFVHQRSHNWGAPATKEWSWPMPLMFSTAPCGRHEATTYQGMVGGAVTCGACEIWGAEWQIGSGARLFC